MGLVPEGGAGEEDGFLQRLDPAGFVSVCGCRDGHPGDQLALGIADGRANAGHTELGFLAIMCPLLLADDAQFGIEAIQ